MGLTAELSRPSSKAAGCPCLEIHLCRIRPPCAWWLLAPITAQGLSLWVLAALVPGEFIFGLSPGSRARPRLRAKRPHFLSLTASLLYHKLSRFIFFSTRKGCGHWCLQQHWRWLSLGHRAIGPPDHEACAHLHKQCLLLSAQNAEGFLQTQFPLLLNHGFFNRAEKPNHILSSAFYYFSHPLVQTSDLGTIRRRITASLVLAACPSPQPIPD